MNSFGVQKKYCAGIGGYSKLVVVVVVVVCFGFE
jgi:hypothetical protein